MVLQTQGSHRTLTPPEKSSRVIFCHLRKCMRLHRGCCYLCLTRVTQRKNNETPCGEIKVLKKTWFLPRGKYTQYYGTTAGHDALSDSGNPSPLALVCTQQSKMTHLLRSQTRNKIFHFFPLFIGTPILNDSKRTSLYRVPNF